MNLFHRKEKTTFDGAAPQGSTPTPPQQGNDGAQPSQPSATQRFEQSEQTTNAPQPDVQLSTLDTARVVFKKRFGYDMPDEVEALFKQLARTEFNLQKSKDGILSDVEISKLTATRKLLSTKLMCAEEALQTIEFQKQWYKTYDVLKQRLEKAKNANFEAVKAYSSAQNDLQSLDRFDQFGKAHSIFQEVYVLKKEMEYILTTQGSIAAEIQQKQNVVDNLHTQMTSCQKKLEDTERQEYRTRTGLNHALILRGETNILEYQQKSKEEEIIRLQAYAREWQLHIKEAQQEYDEMCKKVEDAEQKLHAFEPHRKLIDKGQAVLVRLDHLLTLRKDIDRLQNEMEIKQTENEHSNESLNKVFRLNQNIEQEILRIKQELELHHKAIHGQDLQHMQQRAFELSLQRLQIKRAYLLWGRIKAEYAYTNEKQQHINRIRLHYNTEEQALQFLQQEVNVLRKQCEEMSYAYNMSKSENINSLRQDLREGTSCCVCGATHHPYHSETEIALGELQKSLGQDYKDCVSRLQPKEKELLERQLAHSHESGLLEKETSIYQMKMEELEHDKEQWKEFAFLGTAFADCSANVNHEARTIMLEQLSDNVIKQSEEAKKELEEYTFHQTKINGLNLELAHHKSAMDNNIVTLNEYNTVCQVFASNVEERKEMLKKLSDEYGKLYSDLEHDITLSSWHNEWLKNSDAFKVALQKMINDWKEGVAYLQMLRIKEAELKVKVDNAVNAHEIYESQTVEMMESKIKIEDILNNKKDEYNRMSGTTVPERFYEDVYLEKEEAKRDEQQIRLQYHEQNAQLQVLKGKEAEINRQQLWLEEKIAELRSQLDLWMSRFNADHSPVQYAELEKTYTSAIDWYALRQKTDKVKVDAMLAEIQVNEARQALLQHQGIAMRPTERKEESREGLLEQEERLKKETFQLRTDIAKIDAKLETHHEQINRVAVLNKQLDETRNK